MPIYVLSLAELWRWHKDPDWPKARIAYFGMAILAASFLLKLFQNFFVLYQLLKYPPEFWFVAVADSSALFIMQALGTLLLLLGFFLVHQSCCRTSDGRE